MPDHLQNPSLSASETTATIGGPETAHAGTAVHGAGGPTHETGAGAHPEGGGGSHESGHGGGHVPELENFWNLLSKTSLNKPDAVSHGLVKYFDPYVGDPAHYAKYVANPAKPATLAFEPKKAEIQATLHQTNQNVFFALVTVLVVIVMARRAIRKRAMIPDRAQSLIEMLIGGLRDFFVSILGEKHGPRYVPFLIGLFVFILCNNLVGLVPFMKSATNAFQCNIVLGLCVFLYVQYTGLRYNGPKRYVLHLLGNPESAAQWVFSPLIFVLEVIAELVKPISLSLRLFGNILGEDILLGVFAALGIAITALLTQPLMHVANPIVGIPLHLPFLFLATLTSTIQALIFSLLSCVYILLMLPHDEEHH